ncbi:MAG: FkbM family methyltransferase [Actinomycetota bacterium]|nr:FkbM family methyltransferase [Actinomycetota bacterium]
MSPVAGRHALLVTFGSICQPDGGLLARARLTLEALSALGMRVSVVSHQEPPDAEAQMALPGLDRLVVLQRPVHYGCSWELARLVGEMAPRADVIIVESALLLPAVRAGNRRVPIVWDTNECETLHYQRLPASVANRVKGLFWRRLEGWAAQVCDVAIAISDEEAQSWVSLFPRLQGRTVCVGHRAFVRPSSPRRPPGVTPATPMLLFVGNLVGKQNAVAAEWLLTVLAPRLPRGTALVLAGPGTETLARPPGLDATLHCLGRVDDVDGLIAAADLCLAPLPAGAGVKTKVLHYLAHGKPVIGTPAAFEGIADTVGMVCAPMDGFASEVLRALATVDGPRAEQHGAVPAGEVSDQWAQVLEAVVAGKRDCTDMTQVPAVRQFVRGMRAEVRNWYTLGPLGWIVMPSRCPPRRGLLNHPIAARTVTVRLRSGERIRCRVDELFAVAEVFALATYDAPGIDWKAARNIVDIGANVGAATIWMARRAPDARIVAIEPSPDALQSLRHNVRANGLDARVTVIGCAVGASAGTALLATEGTSVSRRLGSDNGSAVLVPVNSLASVLDDTGMADVDVIKMDCEGAEFEIVPSLGGDLLGRVRAIIGEYHPFPGRGPKDLRRELESAGFSCTFDGNSDIGIFAALLH